jgi:hypothetical protein
MYKDFIRAIRAPAERKSGLSAVDADPLQAIVLRE